MNYRFGSLLFELTSIIQKYGSKCYLSFLCELWRFLTYKERILRDLIHLFIFQDGGPPRGQGAGAGAGTGGGGGQGGGGQGGGGGGGGGGPPQRS